MFSARLFNVLVLALSFLVVAQGSWINANLLGRHVDAVAIEERADTAPDAKAAAASESTTSSSSSAPPTSTSSSSSSSQRQTTTSSSSVSSTSPPTSSSSVPPTTSQTSTSSTPQQTSPPPSTTSQTPETTVVVVTLTDASGNPTGTMTTETTTTPSASGLGSNDSSSTSSSGMPDSTRNTIIGVVVGVGGAIVLAGMALIAWRIWGRKKHQEESDGLMGYNNGPEKHEVGTSAVGSTRSPFQSTLESYHAPTQVNTASNF